MPGLESVSARCPYCGEPIDLLVDPGNFGHAYIEDCRVCCRPISVSLRQAADGSTAVDLHHENES